MDEQNKMQNPMSGQQMGPTPTPSMPQQMPVKGKSMLLWIIIAVALVAAGGAWWYINQMAVEPMVQQQPAVDQEAREDMMINNEIQAADSADIDSEFKTVDNDINSL